MKRTKMRHDRVRALENYIVRDQELLWSQLADAIDNATNRVWSIACEHIVSRIVENVALIGPIHRDRVPWPMLGGGIYFAVLDALELEMEEVTEDEWLKYEKLMAAYGRNRQALIERYAQTWAQITLYISEIEWKNTDD